MSKISHRWFRAFMDEAPDVYFRYSLTPKPAFAYVSRGVQELTGHAAARFEADPIFWTSIVPREDRSVLARLVRARRRLSTIVRIRRPDGTLVPIEVRTVPVIRTRTLVAVEGVASVLASQPSATGSSGDRQEPVQPPLAALLYEVRTLLAQSLVRKDAPFGSRIDPLDAAMLRAGAITLDTHRMTAALDGEMVALTSRELLVLQYLLRRPGRVVTREQLLEDVWGCRFTGDARTVDVHVSRLRRKLPPLRGMLCAVRNIGYRMDPPGTSDALAARIANI